MSRYKIFRPEIEDLAYLDMNEAIVIEGLEEGSIPFFVNWVSDNAGTLHDIIEVYLIKGDLLNRAWSLTGDNCYPDDLNVVAIPFPEIYKPGSLAVKRFEVGARWWSAILENNLKREAEKKNG